MHTAFGFGFMSFVLFVSFLAAPARAADAKPDDEGFIRDWLMLAPSPLPADAQAGDEIDKKQIADESAIKPKAGDKQKLGDKELEWKPVTAKDYYLDFNKTLGSDNTEVVGYLVAYIVCDKDMPDLTLLIGSNDQAKVYVNGKELIKFTETRTIDKDSDKAEKVTLNKGVNVIVFKVINQENDWQACARFKDKDGKPVTAFVVKTAP
jgi:hypothetical protein